MTVKVMAPVEGFSGVVANVEFVDGVGETSDPGALSYFRRHGYEVEAPAEQKSQPAPRKRASAKK